MRGRRGRSWSREMGEDLMLLGEGMRKMARMADDGQGQLRGRNRVQS